MRIELRIERSPDNRLVGRAATADTRDGADAAGVAAGICFSGSMELLAAIERLCPPTGDPA
jgi:hypothetical protein